MTSWGQLIEKARGLKDPNHKIAVAFKGEVVSFSDDSFCTSGL